jgi:hypothetical protein
MTTRQLTIKEMATLIFALAMVALMQAEMTYPNLARVDGWLVAAIFGVVYAAIGGAFGVMASSPSRL